MVLSRRPSAFIFIFQPQIAVREADISLNMLREAFGRFEENVSSTAVIVHFKLYNLNPKSSEK